MKIRIVAVGRMRAGPERSLTEDYIARLDKIGRSLGLGPTQIVEVDDRKGGGMAAEAALLRKASDGLIVCLDERGQLESSPAFATRLTQWRDTGSGTVSFVIGGADGIDPSLRQDASHLISFGPMVWPHMLVRVMLAEQLYRAASIISGSPYHRV